MILHPASSSAADLTEIFASLQGEGIYVGVPQIFIRFNQCNLSCEYCDTPINVPSVPEQTLTQVVEKVKSLYRPRYFHSISLTGGEPLVYAEFLQQLIRQLKKLVSRVYLETNGILHEALEFLIAEVDIIAMDIKLPSALQGQRYGFAHQEFLKTAMQKEVFVKVVLTEVSLESEWREAVQLVANMNSSIPMIMQPATAPSGKLRVTVEQLLPWLEWAKRYLEDVRIVPQVHKMMGIR